MRVHSPRRAAAWEKIGPLVAELVQLEADLDAAAEKKDQARVDSLKAEISKLRRDMQPVSDPLSSRPRAFRASDPVE
jgi:capsule polysaccharide export protein KpsE/RkpR